MNITHLKAELKKTVTIEVFGHNLHWQGKHYENNKHKLLSKLNDYKGLSDFQDLAIEDLEKQILKTKK